MAGDELSKIAENPGRADLGIRDDTRPAEERLTPVGQSNDDIFERRISWQENIDYWWSGIYGKLPCP